MTSTEIETHTHLLSLQTYFSKHLYDRNSAHVIRNELLSKYLSVSGNEFIIKVEKMCPRCFTFWSEGNFRIRRRRKNLVFKCLICSKHTLMPCSSSGNSFFLNKKLEPNKLESRKETSIMPQNKTMKTDLVLKSLAPSRDISILGSTSGKFKKLKAKKPKSFKEEKIISQNDRSKFGKKKNEKQNPKIGNVSEVSGKNKKISSGVSKVSGKKKFLDLLNDWL